MNAMNVIQAETWQELLDHLQAGAWNETLQRFRLRAAFRGSSRVGEGLRTSLSRLGGNYAEKERHIIRNFRKYARRSLDAEDSVWNWLALAKHHGLPTRLLDWSFSPFVALHFATQSSDDFDRDGELWVVGFPQVNRVLPQPLRELLDDEGSDVFSAEMLSSVGSLRDLDRLGDQPFMLFLEPPSLDERIVNQAALFSLLSSARDQPEVWLNQHPDAFRRIVIPARLKWEVRDRLDQLNITERVLFPGLDGLSAWLKRYYRDRE